MYNANAMDRSGARHFILDIEPVQYLDSNS